MKLHEITDFLEMRVPLQFREDYDNCGLLIGDPDVVVTGALLCLDITMKVIEEAVGKGLNLIISHHPILFRGVKKLVSGNGESDLVIRAIKNNLAIYALHTNLDNAPGGLNALVMKKIGVLHPEILSPARNTLSKLVTFVPVDHSDKVRDALFNAGAGVIGNYDSCSFNLPGKGTFRASSAANPFVGKKHQLHVEPEIRIEVIVPSHLLSQVVSEMLKAHPYEEVAYDIYPLSNTFQVYGSGVIGELDSKMKTGDFLSHLKKVLGLKVIRHTKSGRNFVKKIALCTGSGSFLIPDAIAAGADAFITSDLKYHDFFEGEGTILLADIDHYESEHMVKEWLHDALIEKFPNFASLKSQVITNPIHYI